MAKKFRLIVFMVCVVEVCALPVSAIGSIESAKPIKVGTKDIVGPLAFPGIRNRPVGVAFVYGSTRPDLFLLSKRNGPGLFLYKYVETRSNDVPVFADRVEIKVPLDVKRFPSGVVFQSADGQIYGLWLVGSNLVYTVFDKPRYAFVVKQRVELTQVPRVPESIGVLLLADGEVEVLFGISDGVYGFPPKFELEPRYLKYDRDPRYQPYDGTGVWRGGFPYVALYSAPLSGLLDGTVATVRRVSQTHREARNAYGTITVVNLGTGRSRDIITGSHYGNFYYYHNTSTERLDLQTKKYLAGSDGIAIRHLAVWANPVAYPNPRTKLSDLIVGCEGGTFYYRFSGKFTNNGNPVYESPLPVLEKDADLCGGTLVVPNVVDWDGDGMPDIISGNSYGKILFFRNVGARGRPAFLPGVALKAGGREIYIQPGYGQSIQGPGEARWGYTCPAVADWNGDGLPDILMSDSTAKHTVYMNIGTRKEPKLDYGRSLYLDGLDLHGTWRCKPAVAEMGGRMAYVTLDDDDEFHLYWRLDNYNVEDGGKLKLNDGTIICANFLKAGGTGRLKLNFADWDRDGKKDLIIGTCRHSSVPNSGNGLPWSLHDKYPNQSGTILFMKNVGSEQQPVFQFPELMRFKGEPIFLGGHSCGPACADFGNSAGLDMIVGTETGRFIFFKHEDITLE